MFQLDDMTVANYQMVASKIASEYMPYYSNLSSAYSDVKVGIGKIISTQVERLKEILPLLARVSGKGVTPITKKEVSKLNELLENISTNHSQIKQWTKDSTSFKDISKKAAEKHGNTVTPSDLQFAKQAATKSKEQPRGLGGDAIGILGSLSKALGFGSLKRAAPVAALLPLLSSTAGPYIKPIIAAYETFRGAKALGGLIAKPFKRKKSSFGFEKMPAPVSGMIDGIKQATGITAGREQPFRTLSRRKKEMVTEPLFYFFNKRAYKAGWTRDVLAALQKMAGTSKKRGIFGIGGVTGGGLVDTVKDMTLGALLVGKAKTVAGAIKAKALGLLSVLGWVGVGAAVGKIMDTATVNAAEGGSAYAVERILGIGKGQFFENDVLAPVERKIIKKIWGDSDKDKIKTSSSYWWDPGVKGSFMNKLFAELRRETRLPPKDKSVPEGFYGRGKFKSTKLRSRKLSLDQFIIKETIDTVSPKESKFIHIPKGFNPVTGKPIIPLTPDEFRSVDQSQYTILEMINEVKALYEKAIEFMVANTSTGSVVPAAPVVLPSGNEDTLLDDYPTRLLPENRRN